jgi:hypothetical protein
LELDLGNLPTLDTSIACNWIWYCISLLSQEMKLDLPVIASFGRNRITPRYNQGHDMKKMVGHTLRCNMFPTLRGRLLYTYKERCYFVMVENDEWPKYNQCAGQIEWLNEHIVLTMPFENE